MPRKLGQHFLWQASVLAKLASAACGQHATRVIEIGPGQGALTQHLLPLVDELHLIEVDESLVHLLRQKFAAQSNLHIHHSDVLQTNLSQWGPAVIAGNLPYYITSPILEKFLALDSHFPTAVFLVQLEVADRLLAQANSRDFGFLTVKAQLSAAVELICRVEPGAFHPPPKVDSAAVRLIRHPEPPPDLDAILTFASRALHHKRKTLRNNLRPYYGPEVDHHPESALRAEQLGLAGLINFYRRLQPNQTKPEPSA